jgi:hypothetical protein
MLAWVCWDEFVNLENPFKVRWMEKCNESHIAALRIMMRDTLSSAVSSREHNMQPGSPETGQLMSALMMAAMSKLAAMRKSAPTQTITAEDTVTKLMRGLFGNLLTTAGSGVRPMSMVWQLFGQEPKFEVPTTAVAWSWYETVVRLYPFTGWPREEFNLNLEKLLDKALIAIITRNEITTKIKTTRADWTVKYCQLRNIQLDHSRTIVTIFIQMMTSNVDRSVIATRLLAALPPRLEMQTQSYPKMIRYLKYVASTGLRREDDDIVVASVYLKRSAVFKTLKQSVAKACRANNDSEIKKNCQALMAKFKEVAESLELHHTKLIMQNAKAYQGLLDTHCEAGMDMDDFTKTQRKDFIHQVISDAEKSRVPWQVGKEGEFGDDIEPLDEAFVHEIMTGEKAPMPDVTKQESSGTQVAVQPVGMMQFSSGVKADFITKIDNVTTSKDVCKIMNIPVSAMEVFSSALNPQFEWEQHLGINFKNVVIALLSDRKERDKQRPVRRLFGLGENELERVAGALVEIGLGE